MKVNRLNSRDRYLKEAMLFRDTDLIKVMTGGRSRGKSSILDLIRIAVESEGVAGRGFVSVNLESKGTGIKTEDQLYSYVRGRLSDKGRTYVFIDEPQRIDDWQDAVNAMRADFDCDEGRTRALRAGDRRDVRKRDQGARGRPSEVDTRQPREGHMVVRQGSYDTDVDGIRIVSARDFFL